MKNNPFLISIACVILFVYFTLNLNSEQLKALPKKDPNAFIIPVLDLQCKLYSLSNEFQKPNNPNFNVWYIGKWQKKITIEGKIDLDQAPHMESYLIDSETQVKLITKEIVNKHPYLMEEFDERSFKHINEVPFKLTIDTTINYSKDVQKRVYAVYLVNLNSDTVIIGAYNSLSLSFMRWENNHWEYIHQTGWCGCGNGCYSFLLPPKEIAISFIELDRKKTSWFQLRTYKNFSNRFQ